MTRFVTLSMLLIVTALVGCSPFVVTATLVPNVPTQAAVVDEEPPTPTKATSAQIPQQIANTPETAGVCRITPIFESGVNVREAPSGDIVMQLPQNLTVNSDARASVDNEMWYRVRVDTVTGWIAGSFVRPQGTCENLRLETMSVIDQPLAHGGTGGVMPPEMNRADYDRDTYEIVVDADIGAVFENHISYPEGDQIDRLSLMMLTAASERQFSLQVACDGIGVDELRWGTPDNPVMGCNSSVNTTFSPQITQRNIIVTMPDGSMPGSVRYRISYLFSRWQNQKLMVKVGT